MRAKTIVYMIILSVILTNFYPYLQSNQNINIYILTGNTTKLEKKFLSSYKKKTVFGGFQQVEGSVYKHIRKYLKKLDKSLEAPHCINYDIQGSYSPRDRILDTAKIIVMEMIKNPQAIHCFLVLNEGTGLNILKFADYMMDKESQTICILYNKCKFHYQKKDFKWPKKFYDLNTMPQIILVNLNLDNPDTKISIPNKNKFFTEQSLPEEVSCKCISENLESQTKKKAIEGINYLITKAYNLKK
ncbi:MAG: hypothetical protein V1855_05315 [bacterium]